MDIKNKIEEILLTDYQYVDCYTVDKLLDLFAVSRRSEQLVCDACKRDKQTNTLEDCKCGKGKMWTKQTNCC